jgi:uncharacterized protein (DUF1501 family)
MISRRDFLKYSVAVPALASTGVQLLPFPVHASAGNWDRTLILLELKGGNDGLNTVVPYADKMYYDMRPTIAIPRDKVLKHTEKLGFHPAFAPLMPLWQAKQMAVILGVGYPNPNLSHFRGIDIWNSASDADQFLDNGWITQLFRESKPSNDFAADGINLGHNSVGPLEGEKTKVVTLEKNPEKFLRQAGRIKPGNSQTGNSALTHILKQRRDLKSAADNMIAKQIRTVDLGHGFSESKIGAQFETAARLLVAGVKVPVLKLTIKKFDTHAGQEPLHTELLTEIATSISTFAKVMKAKGLWDKVTIMSYSEFGRRPFENNSSGSDHGTAAPHFMFGGSVKGGFYGEQSPLDDLAGVNLKYRIHFREIYASVAREWWRMNADFIREKPLGLFS